MIYYEEVVVVMVAAIVKPAISDRTFDALCGRQESGAEEEEAFIPATPR